MESQVKTNLFGLDQDGLEAFFAEIGEKRFRAGQVLKWIYQRRVLNFADMTDLSRVLREKLHACADVRLPPIVHREVSTDGTRKWLVKVDAGNSVEMVFIPDGQRGTLCVSSQVGCALNCSFCATAKQGFNRNLTSAEVIGQLWLAVGELTEQCQVEQPVTNVVMMGMGEPLLNIDGVFPAMRLMVNDNAFGLARRRVTLSTAGVVPGIYKLKKQIPVSLAVSLHAPNDTLRNELVPINRSFPIRELLAACKSYVKDVPREKITFEYVMLEGINDSPADARALVTLLRGIPSKVNLIPFNPFPTCGYSRSSYETIDRFRDILVRGHLITITRKTRGDDIAAACGQLAGEVKARSRRIRERQALAVEVKAVHERL